MAKRTGERELEKDEGTVLQPSVTLGHLQVIMNSGARGPLGEAGRVVSKLEMRPPITSVLPVDI